MGYLFEASLRSVALAAIAAVCLWRVKSASVRHAVWALVMTGMLLQLFLSPVVPSLPLAVLRPVERAVMPVAVLASPIAAESPVRREPLRLPVLPLLYGAGVVFFAARLLRAYWFTRRLLGSGERIGLRLFQSREIAVPVTAGSKILLSLDWREWDALKLRAVLAHEEAHVRRRDSLVTLVARLNRCVFWFHPLAWWLERELARLAEEACDDAALTATRDREGYARTLLDMARAVHASQGRFLTAAMAKEANVASRIDRVLDESRRIPRAIGSVAWAMLAGAAGPLIYLAAAVQLAPAQTVMPIPTPVVPAPPALFAQAAPEPAPPAPVAPAPPQAPAASPRASEDRPRNATGATIGGPLFIPKIYNSKNKTFFFYQADQLGAVAPSLKISADRSVPGSAIITIRLPDGLEGNPDVDLMASLYDATQHEVLNTRVSHAAGVKTIQLPLAPGDYQLKVLVRNNVDGRIQTAITDFHID